MITAKKSTAFDVTVVIPYDRDRGWLQQAINSVPSGTELILSQSKGTRAYNINRGLEKVKTEFVKFLDEDDYITENCIEDSVRALEGVDFIHGNALNFYPKGKIKPYIPPCKYPTVQSLLKKNTIHNPTQMYRMNVFEKTGLFDESLYSSEDWEFNLRCLSKGLKIGYCNKFLTNYRVHPGQMTKANEERRLINKALVREKYKQWM